VWKRALVERQMAVEEAGIRAGARWPLESAGDRGRVGGKAEARAGAKGGPAEKAPSSRGAST
jgi:hypothetical protein